METPQQLWKEQYKSQFKSYYVVWKPFEQEKKKEFQTWFKSYYVVWKRLKLGA